MTRAPAQVPGSLPISRRTFIAGSVAVAVSSAVLAACGSAELAPSPSPNAWIAVSTAGLQAGEPRWVEFDLADARAMTAPGPGSSVESRPASSRPPAASNAPATPHGTPADTIPPGRGGAWLVQEADGNIVAFVPNCTHHLCLYDWDSARTQFRCRCHPGTFDVEGRVLGGPPPRPLWRYETRPAGPETIEIAVFRPA